MKKIKKIIPSLVRVKDRLHNILNGVLGDTLEKNKNSLAMKMNLYFKGKKLVLSPSFLNKIKASFNTKVCILVHGSCASENAWGFKEDNKLNYGSLLERDLGLTPFYLHYNSGLHISSNGQQLSELLEKLFIHYPYPLEEIVLVGHSMGGLVIRSACHYAEKKNKNWIHLVKKIFYLGSPHLGTHFEKLGKLTTSILNIIPNPLTKLLVNLGDLRSNGIKDLRHGYLTDEDWQEKSADNLFYWPLNKTPLLKSANHYLICGTISKIPNSKMGRLFGDGLVHPASGMGQGLFSSSAIPFLPEYSKIFTGISHNRLQKSSEVYEQIKNWCIS